MALRQLKKRLGPLWFTLQYPQQANLQALTSLSLKHKTQEVQEDNLPTEAWALPVAPNSLLPTQKVEQFCQQGSWISVFPDRKLSKGWSPHPGKSHKPYDDLREEPGLCPPLPSPRCPRLSRLTLATSLSFRDSSSPRPPAPFRCAPVCNWLSFLLHCPLLPLVSAQQGWGKDFFTVWFTDESPVPRQHTTHNTGVNGQPALSPCGVSSLLFIQKKLENYETIGF